MPKLKKDYYLHEDVVKVARDLLGKKLCTRIGGLYTAAIITETEAYAGVGDKASHSYGGRRTQRNEVMYAKGGMAYVYLCYGLHHLFNIVTNHKDIPHAVLIRGVKVIEGVEYALLRRNQTKLAKNTSAGPGTASQAMGITTKMNGTDLLKKEIWLEDAGISFTNDEVKVGPRIGVDYAGEDAKLPYRFLVKEEALKKISLP